MNPSTNIDREDVLQQKHINVEGGIHMVNATKKENQLIAQEHAEPRKLKSSICNTDANSLLYKSLNPVTEISIILDSLINNGSFLLRVFARVNKCKEANKRMRISVILLHSSNNK